MFIDHKRTQHGCTRDGEQWAAGPFLFLASDPAGDFKLRPELRCVLRHVKLMQFGPWMMGHVMLGPFHVCVSGSYGSDGLPTSLRQHFVPKPDGEKGRVPSAFSDDEKAWIWERMTPLPPELQEEFWAGGGHNCAGKEAAPIAAWACANAKALGKQFTGAPPAKKTEEKADGQEANSQAG